MLFRCRSVTIDIDRLRSLLAVQARLLDLSRGEVDIEFLTEQLGHLYQHALSVIPIADAHMAREEIYAGGQAPCVGVVNIGDAFDASDRRIRLRSACYHQQLNSCHESRQLIWVMPGRLLAA
jgi:hypothetical protein